jgi:hypothetical protein
MPVVAASSPSVWAQPGTLGFLVVFGMGVVLFFVFRSMSKHLRKVREAAQSETEQAAEQADRAEPGVMPSQAADRMLNSEYDRFNR